MASHGSEGTMMTSPLATLTIFTISYLIADRSNAGDRTNLAILLRPRVVGPFYCLRWAGMPTDRELCHTLFIDGMYD
jgi:hypothetical protein